MFKGGTILKGLRMSLRLKLILSLIIVVIFTSACSNKPAFNIGDILAKSEVQLNKLDMVTTTASSFDGKTNISFRLMVEGNPSKEEAEKLFNETLNTIATNSNNQDFWNYYNAQFDIKSYENGILYIATKPIGSSKILIQN